MPDFVGASVPDSSSAQHPPGFAEIHLLTLEVLRLAHASDALEAHVPIQFGSARSENLTSQGHTSQPLAS
jgi:hypothetical protein